MNIRLLIGCTVVSFLSATAGSLPVKQWPTAPNRQPHWTGLHSSTLAYQPIKSPTLTAEYEKFLEAKVSGELHPQVTFRPDSWSQYNYHLEKREMKPGNPNQMEYPPLKTLELVLAQENKTVCNASETPNNYCPKTPQQLADELREAHRGLFAGTTLAVIFGVGMAIVYFLSYNFFKYFDYKERWHIERARLKAVRKVNRALVKTGADVPFPENVDQWLLDHPPSRFWGSIFESESFIALLYFIEHRTALNGKFTDVMKRPKLGDEASGIPLNSPRARRRYRHGRQPVSIPVDPIEVHTSFEMALPPPIVCFHRRGRPSGMTSMNALQVLLGGINYFQTNPYANESQDPSRKSYQMPSGFGESPWAPEEDDKGSGPSS
ncbi:hypothetical protein TWF281_006188 [Arthrobotrys megalospora]